MFQITCHLIAYIGANSNVTNINIPNNLKSSITVVKFTSLKNISYFEDEQLL